MGAKSKIEWTDASWNPIRARNIATGKIGWHCTHASEGCRFCYAETRNRNTFYGNGFAYKPGHEKDIDIFLDHKTLTAPLHWKKPRMIFVCSMTDLFADFVKDEWIDRMFAVMALCPQHTFQILTKRPERMRAYISAIVDTFHASPDGMDARFGSICTDLTASPCAAGAFEERDWPLPNVWLGTSVEDQDNADQRIPHLLATSAAVRFLSCEPLLGPIDLQCIIAKVSRDYPLPYVPYNALVSTNWTDGEPCRRVDWVICGGESGPHARPMHPDWARSLRDQCNAASVPFFFKQWGEFAPGEVAAEFLDPEKSALGKSWNDREWTDRWSEPDGHIDDEPDVYRVGKKRAGRLLDGREWNELPEGASS